MDTATKDQSSSILRHPSSIARMLRAGSVDKSDQKNKTNLNFEKNKNQAVWGNTGHKSVSVRLKDANLMLTDESKFRVLGQKTSARKKRRKRISPRKEIKIQSNSLKIDSFDSNSIEKEPRRPSQYPKEDFIVQKALGTEQTIEELEELKKQTEARRQAERMIEEVFSQASPGNKVTSKTLYEKFKLRFNFESQKLNNKRLIEDQIHKINRVLGQGFLNFNLEKDPHLDRRDYLKLIVRAVYTKHLGPSVNSFLFSCFDYSFLSI